MKWRELGAAGIMLLALALTATAQTLVGLPEFGVTLSGTPDNPVVENHADQTIIGHALRLYSVDRNLPLNFANLKGRDIWEGRKGLELNQAEMPLMNFFAVPHPSATFQVQGSVIHTPARVVLDSVVFANGQMVGPDAAMNFAQFAARVEALKELATFALEARQNLSQRPTLWSELERLTTQRPMRTNGRLNLLVLCAWHIGTATTKRFSMPQAVLWPSQLSGKTK